MTAGGTEVSTAGTGGDGPGSWVFPASFGQRRLWFLHLLEPDSGAAYAEHGALRLRGRLDQAALQRSVDTLVGRHETLRTAFGVEDDEPVQLVAERLAVPMSQVDVPGSVADDAPLPDLRAVLDDRIAEELRRPFDLTRPPLFRVVLFRLSERQHVLLVAFHHAIYDQWSGAVFVRELLACYDAYAAGREPELPELPVQYGDFAAWQRERADDAAQDAGLTGWVERLRGLPTLDLPTDRPRPPVQSFAGGTRETRLDRGLVAALEELGGGEGASLFMTVLAGWNCLLSRWTGQSDVAVGSPIAGRTRPELEGLIGFFVNTLVLRTGVDGDVGFREVVRRTRASCLEAYERQDVPFERIVERLAPARDLSRSPLFQVMFVFGNVPMPALRMAGLEAEVFRVDPGTAKFDLFLTFVPDGDGLRAVLEYNAALFAPATADRMLAELTVLLRAAVSDPDTPVAALPLLPAAERDELVAWGCGGPAPEVTPVPAAVAARAAATPDAVAVTDGGTTLTYAELDERAGRLAGYLRSVGAERGSTVAVCLDRGVDLVVALLGVLRSGAAYLPVDPRYPPERIRFVLDDAAVALAVTGSAVADRLPPGVLAIRLDADADAEAVAAAAPLAPEPVGPDDLAYVIHTSGSTGTPKGVRVRHGGLATLLAAVAAETDLGADDVLAAVTTAAFDIAALELLGPLVTGGRVVVVAEAETGDGGALAVRLAASDATVMQATPTTWRLLLDAGWAPPDGFTVLCGGEAFPVDLARRLVRTGARVWNMYGPTETTIWSTVHRLLDPVGDTVPLGHPIAGTELLVVDGTGRRVPVGVPGELWIAGAGVAAGYLDRPELTAERFVPHPEVAGPAYRTGDVVRWTAGGGLEYFGRVDHQVKVRGFRIELGEIEAALRSVPGVADAAAAVAPGAGGEPAVVGYLVPSTRDTSDQTAAGLTEAARDRARELLPDHMVPAAVLVLDALPLTPNGKLDRAALPAPDGSRPEVGAFVPPRTPVETRLAAIWADVLGVDQVGVHDDFFGLGGHSLLATRVVGRIRAQLGAELPVRAVFQHPTVADLAGLVGAVDPAPDAGGHPTSIPAVPRRPEESGEHAGAVLLPASAQQRRIWFLQQLDPDSGPAYVLHGGLRLRGRLDSDALQRAVDAVVARHETLRTGFAVLDGEPVQVVRSSVAAPVTETTVDGPDPEAALAALARDEAARPFDLAAAPLLRVTLARLGAEDTALLVSLHHAVADRIGIQVLVSELSAAYAAAVGGRAAPALPQLPVQYGDYAAWQADRLVGDDVAAQLGYWRERLADLPVLELATDLPRPAERGYRGATRDALLPAPLVADLGTVAASRQATVYMALLSAYAILLSRYSGRTDVPVGSPVSGRPRPELDGLIGYLTNNLVLRVDLSGDPSVAELLDRVRETCLDGFDRAEVPFERLVEELRPARDLAHSPLFQAMFILTDLAAPSPDLPGLQVSGLHSPEQTAKYDLTFTLFAEDGGFRVVAEYSAELFLPSTVDRMLAHYRMLVESLTGDPTRSLSDLPELPRAERAELAAWGTGPSRDVPELTLPGLLGPALHRDPDRVAVTHGGASLTAAELDRRADLLAARLRAAGIGRGGIVALWLDRSRELMVSVLGVLRSGAAYLPIDTSFPADRVRFLLEDSGSVAVLTTAALRTTLPGPAPAVLEVDADADAVAEPAAGDAGPAAGGAGPSDPAYVIYTSGSTGRPKGVLVPHRAVVNFLLTMADRPGLAAGDVLGAASTIGCDMPVLDLYLPLLTGAGLVMIDPDDVLDGARLAALLAGSGVSCLQGTPTTWRLLQAAGWRPPAGFTALAGAEKVPADLARWLLDGGAALWHLYGPTETTVWSTVHRVGPEDDPLPLGEPVAETRLIVVDGAGRRVPIGVPGELWIGGAGVADGYLGRPELTAERFVSHPELPGRLYRTGDLVRWTTDGRLEFLGRIDFQVKVRGFRIELGEIEAALRGHPAVRDAVVVLREDEPDDPRLVGYVDLGPAATAGAAVTSAGRARLATELRSHVGGSLPAYMVPAVVVVLDALPLTANRNKVDRAALPAPDGLRPDLPGFVAARTPTETRLAEIWAEVLGVHRVGADDDFFALGGHSLLATRVAGRIRAALGVEVPVRAIFQHRTVGTLAAHLGLDTAAPAAAPSPPAPIPVQFRLPQLGGDLAGRYVLPASSGQRRLWFLSELDSTAAGAYRIDTAARLTGSLDPDALQRALDAVVARHETLRTAFVEVDGEPVQVVSPTLGVPLRLLDLGSVQDLDAAVAELVRAAAVEPFDLATPPLVRVTLARLGADDHLLHVALHHVVGDRWSVQVLLRELVSAYEAFATGSAPTLPDLPVQYADWAAARLGWLAGPQATAEVAHWRDRLAGAPVLEVPTDRPRPAVRGHRGSLRWYELPADLLHRVDELARLLDATPFMVTLAAFDLLLARYSGQRDVVVGSPVAGRDRPETEPLIGFFVNTLVLRTDLTGDPTVAELVGRVRETCLDGYAHAELPFERLVEDLRPSRDLGRTPLFGVLFALQNTPVSGREMAGLQVTPVDVDPGTSQFDLSVMVVPTPGGARLRVEYDTELLDESTVDRMAAHYRMLLEEFTAAPQRRLSALPPMPAAELETVLGEWGRTEEQEVPATLPALLTDWAARTPSAAAVECGDEWLTYLDLTSRAFRLARHLRSLGADREVKVALCLERTPDLLVGIVGVLASGAAYVPVDPGWPADRIGYVLGDSGSAVLLTESTLADRLPDFAGPVVRLDADSAEIDALEPLPPGIEPQVDDLAYVIYTSGSTGRPKGTLVTHRNVVRLVTGAATLLDVGPDDAWSLFHSAAFDVSVFEMWGAWLTGGRVVVVPYLVSREPAGFRALLAERGVTVCSQTPTAFGQLAAADAEAAEPLPALRYVLFAGEALDVRSLASWLGRYGEDRPRLVNLYGTTETTVHATVHFVRAAELRPPVRGLIGRPLPDLRFSLRDGDGRPVPIGVPGEIHIAGPGVARGYLGRDELTAERFPADPLAPPGAEDPRAYRTGDRARRLPDGTLDFLGRMDAQVKIRGFRVEPGEVEGVLREHPRVHDAVVIPVGRDADTRLAAYVAVGPSTSDGLVAELAAHTRRLLPEYMVPASITLLDALPRTANGKVDRVALPEPEGGRLGPATPVPPRTPLEERLVAIWTEVLGVRSVGVHDNFFDLGGHSLLATRVASRVRAAFGTVIAVRTLFERPTVADLAEVLAGGPSGVDGTGRPSASLGPLTVLPRRPETDGPHAGALVLPASSGQRRLWFLAELDPADSAAYVIGTRVRLTGPLDAALLRHAVDAVVARHETLRTGLSTLDGVPVQVVRADVESPLRLVDLPAGERDAALAAFTRTELAQPFDLAVPPLLRLSVARVGPAEHVLLLALHHAVGDQRSVQALVHEVVTGYEALVTGRAAALPDLPAQYADWAAGQDGWLRDAEADRQRAFWRERLAGLPVLDLATDRPRPELRASRGALLTLDLPGELADGVGRLARERGATPFMVGLAAYELLLARYSGQRDFGVATVLSGRDRPETEPLIGFFANTVVLRSDLPGLPAGGTVGELVDRVRETCLSGYANADLPFGRLAEDVEAARDLSRTPLAQAGFAFTEELSVADRRMGEVWVRREPFDPGTAKTDLTVTLTPTPTGLHAEFEYDTALFDRSTVERMAAHYRMLLAELVADADRAVSALPPVPGSEAVLLARWGTGPMQKLPDATVADLFVEQAGRTPDRTALVVGDTELTYAELAERASKLAHHLQALGVGPEITVAILVERSVEMVVGVLGVLLAGGAYVPVDPAYPAERVAFLLEDSAAPVLLTQRALASRVDDAGATVVLLDGDRDEIDRHPGTPPERKSTRDSLAYVIYTSGSTGTPKGVLVTNRSVVNLHLTRPLAGFHDGSRILQFAPFSFDVSVWEMVMALLGGHVLVVPRPADLAGGVEIVRLITEQRVTMTFLPPSLMAHLGPEQLPTVQTVGSGGEDCPADVAERWGGQKRFLIGYGPTETTVYSTVTGEITGGGHPPIGRPVCNTVLHVLDADRRPVPIGVPGELYIGGAGLARGYLRRPEQTAERFVPDPVGPDPDARLYRTGDLVRHLLDGDLEFLGRLDDQVKLRGFRIELGEVEAALRAQQGVREAVATVREDSPGDQRLVGYIVPAVAPENPADAAALARAAREAVRVGLPHYMVPAVVCCLEAIPLSPNGKVDRRALPAPAGDVGTGREHRPPVTETERRMAVIFGEALGVDRVGLDDSFFELGGHSLLAARVHATIRATWRVDLPVRVIFEHPRLGELAALLDEATRPDPACTEDPAAPAAAAEAAHEATLRADIVLAAEIRPAGPAAWTPAPAEILLTGATGFLGGFLLERLLADTPATVHCLVRGRDDADAAARLRAHLTGLGLWQDGWAERVRAVAGELAEPALGLAERRFAELAERVQEIHHSGAQVHFLRPYSDLRDANVGGTREILRMAATGPATPVHHVSTLSVFGGVDPDTPVLREDVLPDVPPPAGDTGYNASKWVAEHVVALARARGLPVAVHRPGRIGGDSRVGTWRVDDLICQLVRACAVVGAVPDAGLATDLVPVDHLAAVISRLARIPASLGGTFHVALPHKVPLVLLADALAEGGWSVRRVGVADWYARVRVAAETDVALGPVLAMYGRLADGTASGPGEPGFGGEATRALLGAGLPAPEVGVPVLGRYLDWLERAGALPPRAAGARRRGGA